MLLLLAVLTTAVGCPSSDPDNLPPELTLDVRSEETYVVGEDVVRIQANATDPEGESITWEVVNLPERAELQTFSNSALVTWDPIASDVTQNDPLRLIFAATDASGQRTERVVNLTILAGNGVPRFLSSASYLYDAEGDGLISFDVEVRDDDSTDLQLSMRSDTAPAGARFELLEQTGSGIHRGEFQWEPTLQQRNTRIHSVTFVADDGENDPVTQKVTLIFQTDTGGGGGDPDPTEECGAGQPIEHEPLGAQRTLDPYRIEATFKSGEADTWDVAYLFWARDNPFAESTELESSEMKIDGEQLKAVLPNPALPSGQAETIYYSICLGDSDAPEDSEDRFVCVPSSTYWSFHAYSPDDTQCIDDSAGGNFDSAEQISAESWGFYRGCKGLPDVHEVTVPGRRDRRGLRHLFERHRDFRDGLRSGAEGTRSGRRLRLPWYFVSRAERCWLGRDILRRGRGQRCALSGARLWANGLIGLLG